MRMPGSMPATTLLLRGYGPVVALVLAFGLVVALVPTVSEPSGIAAGAGEGSGSAAGAGTGATSEGAGGDPGAAPETGAAPGSGGPAQAGDPADGDAGASRGGGEDGPGTGDAGGPQADGDGGEPGAAPGVRACEDRELQIPGDPYSPPCVAFEGENPGGASRGVTAEEIVISARTPDQAGFQDTLANLGDSAIADSQEDVRRTIAALVDYVNERFELYGRELRVEFYDGTSDTTEEAMGGAQSTARADALTAADDIGAFAELNGSTEPFGSALASEGVIAIGAPHLSAEWMTERRPYSWSVATDCSTIARTSSEFGNVRLRGREAAYAGDPDLRGQERNMATVVPENPVYQQCLATAEQAARDAGFEPPRAITYRLDIGTMSNQAANIIAELQDAGITTVTCSCDPVLPVFLTARAQEQDYHPEWVITGSGYTDQDIVGQLMDQEQWSRAFGISYNAAAQPMQATLGYNAYKQVRDDEPAFAVGSIYYSLYLLAIGIQGAGPELTPETFEQGMFDYPTRSGPAGTWSFSEGNYSAPEDFREIYWDPEAVSTFNNERGAYRETDPGTRHFPGELPEGGPRVPW